MPRRKGSASTASAIRQVRRQAGAVLAKLRKDIRAMETELARLKHDEDLWGRLAGARQCRRRCCTCAAGRERPVAAVAASGGRINWRSVLAQLPKQFKASNVRQIRGLKDKRPSEIFAAITRWIEAGLAKRKTRGALRKSLARKPHHRFRIAHCRGSAGAMCYRTTVTALPRTCRGASYAGNIYSPARRDSRENRVRGCIQKRRARTRSPLTPADSELVRLIRNGCKDHRMAQ